MVQLGLWMSPIITRLVIVTKNDYFIILHGSLGSSSSLSFKIRFKSR
jgi:hypothetical protein